MSRRNKCQGRTFVVIANTAFSPKDLLLSNCHFRIPYNFRQITCVQQMVNINESRKDRQYHCSQLRRHQSSLLLRIENWSFGGVFVVHYYLRPVAIEQLA